MFKISDYIGEATEYDKKVALEESKPKSWLKSVSAFANGAGGVLIFGVDDNDNLIGLNDIKHISEKISEKLKERMDPIPIVIMENHKEEDKDFLLLKVIPGKETPYYYVGDGSRLAFIRVGNESVPTDNVALKRLVLKGSGKTYDSLPTDYLLEKYAFKSLISVYRMKTGKEFLESDFVSFGLATEDGYLTNAGILLADNSPVYHSRLFCTRWYGLDMTSGVMEATDDKEFRDSLITLLQNGEEFVKNNTKKRWKKTADSRIEMPDYPERAITEALVNAIIHRDYLMTGSEVHIDIFDNRIEIYSPGGMLDGSKVQTLNTENIPSLRRNPVIADLFSRINFMERRGSGFKKINADYRNAVNFKENLAPIYYSDNNSFKITLFNLNYDVPIENEDVNVYVKENVKENVNVKLTTNEQKVLQYIKENPSAKRKEIIDDLSLSRSIVDRAIKKLKNYNMVDHSRTDKNGYWIIL